MSKFTARDLADLANYMLGPGRGLDYSKNILVATALVSFATQKLTEQPEQEFSPAVSLESINKARGSLNLLPLEPIEGETETARSASGAVGDRPAVAREIFYDLAAEIRALAGLTAAQRKRLAKEMRGLAMECWDGLAPYLDADSYCTCFIGESMHRGLGVRPEEPGSQEMRTAIEIDALLPDDRDLARMLGREAGSEGLISAVLHYDHSGKSLPFIGLALADEVEAVDAD